MDPLLVEPLSLGTTAEFGLHRVRFIPTLFRGHVAVCP